MEQNGSFEERLTQIPGVLSARVTGGDSPTEVHIVATPQRSPKQIMRDVRSLAAAGYGIEIDHRIVSVAQVEAAATDSGTEPRAVISWLYTASKGDSGRVDIGLSWPWGERAGGATHTSLHRNARARAGADAVLKALEADLVDRGATVDLEGIFIERFGSTDSVLVKARFRDRDGSTPLIGTAAVEGGIVAASARALLNALNRKLAQVAGHP